jgi:hypothetical protein
MDILETNIVSELGGRKTIPGVLPRRTCAFAHCERASGCTSIALLARIASRT